MLHGRHDLLHETPQAVHEPPHRGRDVHGGQSQQTGVLVQRAPELLADEAAVGGGALRRRGRQLGLLAHRLLQELRDGARLVRVADLHQSAVLLKQPLSDLRQDRRSPLLAQGVPVLVHMPRQRLLRALDQPGSQHGGLKLLQTLPAVSAAGVEVLQQGPRDVGPKTLAQGNEHLVQATGPMVLDKLQQRLQGREHALNKPKSALRSGLSCKLHVSMRHDVLDADAVVHFDPPPRDPLVRGIHDDTWLQLPANRQPPGRLQQWREDLSVRRLGKLLDPSSSELQDVQGVPDLVQRRRRRSPGP
mmetsp:Transcript_92867/g.266167  ORF Transcript_92867/g.266167 Transcript_92867/m.266167 type:complete len:303 (+) Transcript_92867:941-1849(+)